VRLPIRLRLTLVYAVLLVVVTGVLLGMSWWLLARHLDRTVAPAMAGDVLNHVAAQFALGVAGSALVALGLGWIAAGRALAPLRTIAATARRIAEGPARRSRPRRRAARRGPRPRRGVRRDARPARGGGRRAAPVRRQRRPRAACLGLSMCAAVAEAHGGTLRLRARPEGGLAAEVRLSALVPWAEDEESRPLATAPVGEAAR
jgi:hypothetical protein